MMVDLNSIVFNFIDLALNLVSWVCAKIIHFVPISIVFSSISLEFVDPKPEFSQTSSNVRSAFRFLGFRSKNG